MASPSFQPGRILIYTIKSIDEPIRQCANEGRVHIQTDWILSGEGNKQSTIQHCLMQHIALAARHSREALDKLHWNRSPQMRVLKFIFLTMHQLVFNFAITTNHKYTPKIIRNTHRNNKTTGHRICYIALEGTLLHTYGCRDG
jgi:hypothetical protein